MSTPVFDVAIIGGGVNGCGIARDAAGRGASVVLFEQGDLAGATSSASTKLIHGGLRYLEHYEFRLVREALTEREVIWRAAPHIVRPLRFVLPHHEGLRPEQPGRGPLFLDAAGDGLHAADEQHDVPRHAGHVFLPREHVDAGDEEQRQAQDGDGGDVPAGPVAGLAWP